VLKLPLNQDILIEVCFVCVDNCWTPAASAELRHGLSTAKQRQCIPQLSSVSLHSADIACSFSGTVVL